MKHAISKFMGHKNYSMALQRGDVKTMLYFLNQVVVKQISTALVRRINFFKRTVALNPLYDGSSNLK